MRSTQRCWALVVLLCAASSYAQEELFQLPVNLLQNCFQCCVATNKAFDAELQLFACQEGCANNIEGIDAQNQVQKSSFDIGLQFLQTGQSSIVSADQTFTLLCSAAGDFSSIQLDAQGNAVDVTEAVCQSCCTELNGQFDNGVNNGIDDAYSVAKCQDTGCDDNFANINCADEAQLRDQLGCELGQFFRTAGGVGFKALNHVCKGLNDLDTFGATLVDTCEACCSQLTEVKNDLNLAACQNEGCGAIAVCANSALDIVSCNLGRDLLLAGIVNINGNSFQCVFDQNLNAADLSVFVDLQGSNELRAEDIAVIAGGSVGALVVLGSLLFFIRRKRSPKKSFLTPSGLAPPGSLYGAKTVTTTDPGALSSYDGISDHGRNGYGKKWQTGSEYGDSSNYTPNYGKADRRY